jgi:hypothetical protein
MRRNMRAGTKTALLLLTGGRFGGGAENRAEHGAQEFIGQ